MADVLKALWGPSLAVLVLFAPGAGADALAQDSAAEQPEANADARKNTVETFETWTVVCSSAEKKRCVAQQQLSNPNNQQIIASATVRLTKDGFAELSVQTPSGVMLAPGVTLKVDDKETAQAPFVACAPRACEANFKIDQNLINSLAKGKTLSARVQSLRGKDVGIDFQLNGFVKAYAAFKNGVNTQ